VLLAVVLALSVFVLMALVPSTEAQAATKISKKLAALEVKLAGTMDGYSRDLFPHWSNAQEYGWTLRRRAGSWGRVIEVPGVGTS